MMGRLDFGHLLLRQRRTFSDDCCAGAGRLNFRPPDIVLTGRSTLLGQGATMDGGGLRRGRDCILGQEGEAQPPHARLDGRSINYSTSPSQSINGDNRLLVAMSGVPNLKGAFPPDLENGGNFEFLKLGFADTFVRSWHPVAYASRIPHFQERSEDSADSVSRMVSDRLICGRLPAFNDVVRRGACERSRQRRSARPCGTPAATGTKTGVPLPSGCYHLRRSSSFRL